jgi:hypothetical protein
MCLAGDIEPNPGPTTHTTQDTQDTFTCNICNKSITKKQYAIRCNHHTSHWLHKSCTQTKLAQYSSTWTCTAHDAAHHQNNIITHQASTQTPNSAPPASSTTLKSTSATTTTQQLPNTQKKPNTQLTIIQININGLGNKITELTQLAHNTNADVITIQESKLTTKSKTPTIANYTAIRKDRTRDKGGGLITFIKNNITFTETTLPVTINQNTTEAQVTKLHLSQKKEMNIANIYIHPRTSTTASEDTDITNCFQHLTTIPNTIITADANAHSSLWHSHTTDHRGSLIEDIIQNSNHICLNTDTPTRLPLASNQKNTSPDITTISNNLLAHTTWTTKTALSSDHLPIIITINTKTNFRLIQNRHSFTNYNKADWDKFTQEIEDTMAQTTPTSNTYIANKIITNAILSADKHHIPKGKLQTTNLLLPQPIRDNIHKRDQLRQQNPKDENIKTINNEITRQISQHKSDLWKTKLEEHWDHKQNTHILWKTINSLSNKKPPQQPNRTITFKDKTVTTPNKIASSFNHQFVNVTKYSTEKQNRTIDRHTNKINSTFIQITPEQVKHAISSSKNNNSTGADGINIKHLKHLGPIALEFLTNLYSTTVNTNEIPQIWKLAKIVPILKPDKDPGQGTSYRPISLLSPIAKTLEKIVLPYITENIPNQEHQHGFKTKHSTTTALHNINNTIIQGFNRKAPPQRTVMVALDMSKAFDTVNIHKLIHKLHQTNTPNTIIKFTANYIKGRQAFTTYQNCNSKLKQLKTGVPQGGVLSPTLFNIYMSDIPSPPPNIDLETYADDITTESSHTNIEIAQDNLQPYLQDIHNWTIENNLTLNAGKSTSTLFTPDPAEYNTQLHLSINNTLIPTVKNPKVLGLTFDPKLTYAEHIKNTTAKASKTINILKTLTSTQWGKQKETITATYKAITRPILEYSSTIWSPIASDTNINKLQTIQNTALRIATGCTADTNIQHLHDETQILPLQQHLKLHASQVHQTAQLQTHPLYKLTKQQTPQRKMKNSIFQPNSNYITHIPTSDNVTAKETEINKKLIHTSVVQSYLNTRTKNKILNDIPPKINPEEESLPRKTRRTLSQLRTGKSPILNSYKHKIDPVSNTSSLCPLCKQHDHTTEHIFTCTQIQTTLGVRDLWDDPVGVAALLDGWEEKVGESGG